MPVHNHTYVTEHLVLVGNESTVDSGMLARLSANSIGQVIECVVVETGALARRGIVTADTEICDAISLAHKLRAGVFVPFPSDLGNPGHVFQLLGACLMSGVPLFLNPSAVPWSRAILPGLPLTEAVGHVVAGWEQYASAAIAEVLAAEVHAQLKISVERGRNFDWDKAVHERFSITLGNLSRAIAMLERNQMEPRQICRLMNVLQVPRGDGSRRWTVKYLARQLAASKSQHTSSGTAGAAVAKSLTRTLRGTAGAIHPASSTSQGAGKRVQRGGNGSASSSSSANDQESGA